MGSRFLASCASLLVAGLVFGCTAATPGGPDGTGQWASIAQAPGGGSTAFTTPPSGTTSIAALPASAPQPSAPQPAMPQPAVEPTQPAQPAPAAPARPAEPEFTFRFSVGDEVDVSIWREKELSATHRVLRDGTISPPLLDPVRVEGLTIREVRTELLPLYRKYIKDPRVSVRVVNVHSNRVYVLGEVGEPSAVVAAGRTTALQAIAQSGGFEMEYADRDRVRVVRTIRGKAHVTTVNANAVIAGRQRDVLLQPGDVIFVPAKGLTDWSRNLTQLLSPLSELLGQAGSIATTIVAIDSLNN